jgi:hypothetical protein
MQGKVVAHQRDPDRRIKRTTSSLDGFGTPRQHYELVLRILRSGDGCRRNPT